MSLTWLSSTLSRGADDGQYPRVVHFTAGAVVAATTALTAKAPVYATSGAAFVDGDELYSDGVRDRKSVV